MRLPWRSTNGSDSCTAASRVPERVIYPSCGLFVAALTQILVVYSRVEVYTVGAAVGVDEVVQLQQVTSFRSSPKVLWASYIVVSPDSLSVRKLPGFSQSGGRKQAKQLCSSRIYLFFCCTYAHDYRPTFYCMYGPE